MPQDANAGGDRSVTATQTLRGSNQSGLRAYNQRLVLSLVYTHGKLAKTDIARMTGVSKQAGWKRWKNLTQRPDAVWLTDDRECW